MERTQRWHTPFQLWFSFLRERWPQYLLGMLAVILCNVAQVGIPRLIGYGIDFLRGGSIPPFLQKVGPLETFKFIFLLFLALTTLLLVGRVIWRICLGRPTHLAAAWLRRKLWRHIVLLPQHKLAREYPVGTLMNNSTSDVDSARYAYGFSLVATFDVIFLGVVIFLMMYQINPAMTFWTFALFPLLPPLLSRLATLEGQRFDESQEYLSSFNDQAAQAVATIKLQRLTQTGKVWEEKLNHAAHEYRDMRLKAIHTGLRFYPSMGAGSLFTYAVLFLLGINKTFQGDISPGDFVAMQSFILLLQDPLMELGFIISEWQKSATSLRRLAKVYNEAAAPELVRPGVAAPTSKDVFVAQNLSFSYREDGKKGHPIIKNLNLHIQAGDRFGITGPIGSGKTTLINILAGLERGVQGRLLFMGRPFSDWGHSSLRQKMLMVPQKTFLFADTIYHNVAMDQELREDQVWYYLEVAGLKADVESFPLGLKTPLGEWGLNLSGGQKQRLTLARALAQRPQVLLLDDCLSAVDTVTEESILQAMDRELKSTTLIWVAHRKSTLKYCHHILELA